jgi:predicted nucleic acid-binding Zn ribbon protein
MFKRRSKKKRGNSKYKFCPVCGTQLLIDDTYCTHCGYSFDKRRKKKKGIKWGRIILLLLLLLLVYVGISYANNQPIIPESIINLLNNSGQ